MKNITLAIDEKILEMGREYARQHNMSFNLLVRRLVEQAVRPTAKQWLHDAYELMDRADGSSQGNPWTREELYRV